MDIDDPGTPAPSLVPAGDELTPQPGDVDIDGPEAFTPTDELTPQPGDVDIDGPEAFTPTDELTPQPGDVDIDGPEAFTPTDELTPQPGDVDIDGPEAFTPTDELTPQPGDVDIDGPEAFTPTDELTPQPGDVDIDGPEAFTPTDDLTPQQRIDAAATDLSPHQEAFERYQALSGMVAPYGELAELTAEVNGLMRETTGVGLRDSQYVGLRLDAHHIIEATWFDRFATEFKDTLGWESRNDMACIALPTESHIRSGDKMAQNLGLTGAEGVSSLTKQLQNWLVDRQRDETGNPRPFQNLEELVRATEAYYFREVSRRGPSGEPTSAPVVDLDARPTYSALRKFFDDVYMRLGVKR